MKLSALAIDPSVNDVGYAYWLDGKGWECGSISLRKVGDIHVRCRQLVTELNRFKPQQLVYEQPTFMAGTKGKIASQKGYTIDLGFVCGYCCGHFGVSPFDMFGYTPNEWKGSVPKHVTEAKYYRTFDRVDGEPLPSDHEIDATMMLHYHLTKYKII